MSLRAVVVGGHSPRAPQARLDVAGALHHSILLGMEWGRIVADREDGEAFVACLGEVKTATGTPLYAWALLPNHAHHLLLRSGAQGLPQFMRRRLTGSALTDNRHHRRVGHLFQNRYTLIVGEDYAYFRDQVCDLHFNPLRAGLVPDPAHLDRYPWCDHEGILGCQGLPGWIGPPSWPGLGGRNASRFRPNAPTTQRGIMAIPSPPLLRLRGWPSPLHRT